MAPRGTIPWAKPHFWDKEIHYVADALASTWISGGPFVERFEEALTAELGVSYAVVVSNGTAALHLAYLALGIGPGDEVIVPGFAFQAAANVARHVGAVPVFAEVDPDSWCLDATDVERRISRHTKLIVPVHTYGNVCDMNSLRSLGEITRTPILEDSAEALGSRWEGEMAGALGLMGILSFQAAKTITTGEGGAVLTSDRELYDRMRLFRNHGMGAMHYWHEVVGHNFRLTNIQAAIGCAQLECLDRIVQERQRVHRRYVANLGGQVGISMQHFANAVEPVLWAMAVRLSTDAFPQDRDAVMQQLQATGIETRVGFYAASELGIFECGPLPICEAISRSVMSLPTFPTLSNEEIDFICNRLLRLRA